MITIHLTREDLSNDNVQTAAENLIRALTSVEGTVQGGVKKSAQQHVSVAQRSRASESIDIDSQIEAAYGEILKKQKSLYFLTIVKRSGVISSAEVIEDMMKVFPHFSAKSIGGITGAIRRWLEEAGVQKPFIHTSDKYGNAVFEWVGESHQKARRSRTRR